MMEVIEWILQYLQYIWDIVVYRRWLLWLVALGIGMYSCRLYGNGKITAIQCLCSILTSVYAAVILIVTVLSRTTLQNYQLSVIPFWSYLKMFTGDIRYTKQIVANILFFIPLGMTAAGIWKKHRIRNTAFLGTGISVIAESLQLVLKRGFAEPDDIFDNMLGAVIGALLIAVFCRVKAYRKHNEPAE